MHNVTRVSYIRTHGALTRIAPNQSGRYRRKIKETFARINRSHVEKKPERYPLPDEACGMPLAGSDCAATRVKAKAGAVGIASKSADERRPDRDVWTSGSISDSTALSTRILT